MQRLIFFALETAVVASRFKIYPIGCRGFAFYQRIEPLPLLQRAAPVQWFFAQRVCITLCVRDTKTEHMETQ